MKKTLFLSLTIFIFLVGCNKSSSDELKYKFDSSPSSGYIWIYEIEHIDILKVKEDFDIDDECVMDKECSGKQIFTIFGIQKGESKITFKYLSEKDVKYTKVYNIKVSDDLSVSESH